MDQQNQAYSQDGLSQETPSVSTHCDKRRRGVAIYACIVTVLLLVCLGIVLALWLKTPDTTVGLVGQEQTADEQTLGGALDAACNSVVIVYANRTEDTGVGAGIILTSDGYIATNAHVINGAQSVVVSFRNGKEATASVIGISDTTDLAILKVFMRDLPTATFATSKDCYVGQLVYAVGTPANARYGWTVTNGIISYVDREIVAEDGQKHLMLQTDATVNQGNSGGPLLNAAGQVVGIVTMKLSNDYKGIAFAIPSDTAVKFFNECISGWIPTDTDATTRVPTPVLGIQGMYVEQGHTYVYANNTLTEIDPAVAEVDPSRTFSPLQSGIFVLGVTDGFDAATKLSVADLIISVNGSAATSLADVERMIKEAQVGDTFQIAFLRGSVWSTVDVKLGGQP